MRITHTSLFSCWGPKSKSTKNNLGTSSEQYATGSHDFLLVYWILDPGKTVVELLSHICAAKKYVRAKMEGNVSYQMKNWNTVWLLDSNPYLSFAGLCPNLHQEARPRPYYAPFLEFWMRRCDEWLILLTAAAAATGMKYEVRWARGQVAICHSLDDLTGSIRVMKYDHHHHHHHQQQHSNRTGKNID